MDYKENYKLDVFDTYSFIIIAPISGIMSLLLFMVHIFSKDLRKQPGDLILMISLMEFLLSCHYFGVGYKTNYISTGTEDGELYCRVTGIISTFAQFTQYCYSICFLIHIYFTMNSSIQKGFVPKRMYHFMALFIGSVAAFGYDWFGSIGKDPYGICSTRVGSLTDFKVKTSIQEVVLNTIAIILGVFLAIFVLFYTQKRLPDLGKDQVHQRRDFLNYYKTYIKTCIMFWTIIFLAFLAQCSFWDDQNPDSKSESKIRGIIHDVGRIGNTAKVLLPLVFFFVRIQDPTIRKRIWLPFKYLLRFGTEKLRSGSSEGTSDFDDQMAEPEKEFLEKPNYEFKMEKNDFISELDRSIMEDVQESDVNDQNFLNLMPALVKEMYTRTFLASISCKYDDLLKKNDIKSQGPASESIMRFQIKGKVLKELLNTDKKISDCKFAVYYPDVFREIINSCTSKVVDLSKSLNIFDNEANIKKAGESGGGASGELFLFSFDNQLILKTAKHDEIQVFSKILMDYKDHVIANTNTQIGKIYGLFDFTFRETDKSIKLVLIENIYSISQERILRKYDLKGSTYSRRALKNPKEISKAMRSSKVMKDLDFKEIEKCIHIDQDKRSKLLKNIDEDIKFFTKHHIIDYSLILAVVIILLIILGSDRC